MFNYGKFVDYLNDCKREYGLTFAQIAEMADISVENLIRIANGHHKPNLYSIISILNALNIDLAAIENNAIQSKQKYLRTEINKQFSVLSQTEKKVVLNIIDKMYQYEIEKRVHFDTE